MEEEKVFFDELLSNKLTEMDLPGAWLARRLGVKRSTVNRWCNGGARPGEPELVIRIADLLDVHDTEERRQLLIAAGYASYVPDSDPEAFPPVPFSLDELPPIGVLAEGSSILPYHPNDRFFVGRKEELRELACFFWGEDGKGGHERGKTALVTGLGGIGKTQLASEFAYRYGPYFEGGVYWIMMEQPESVPTSVVTAAGRMIGLPGPVLGTQDRGCGEEGGVYPSRMEQADPPTADF